MRRTDTAVGNAKRPKALLAQSSEVLACAHPVRLAEGAHVPRTRLMVRRMLQHIFGSALDDQQPLRLAGLFQ